MRSWDLQQAIYDRLTGYADLMAIATAVYDHVPQDAVFPYVVIGEDIANPHSVDDSLDTDHVLTVHAWSRYRGEKETKQIQQATYAALHREPLTVASSVYVDCEIESQETFLDDDGLTQHGVQRFRVLLDDIVR